MRHLTDLVFAATLSVHESATNQRTNHRKRETDSVRNVRTHRNVQSSMEDNYLNNELTMAMFEMHGCWGTLLNRFEQSFLIVGCSHAQELIEAL